MKTLTCALAGAFLFFAGTNLWAVPAGFNIQGRLTDANGINKDGTFQIKFSVFTTATGGSSVWEKNLPAVPVKNGNFQVILQGAGDNSVQLETAVKDLEAAYVEIKVGNEPPLVPRQPLLRSPFSASDRVSGKADVLIQSDSQNTGSGNIVMKTGNADRLTILNEGNVMVTGSLYASNFVGAVMFFAGPTCPAGWLLANGTNLPTTGVYAALFNYLKYTYGQVGEDFVLPNMVDGTFIRSTGGNAGVLGIKQNDEFRNHMHPYRYEPVGRDSGGRASLGPNVWQSYKYTEYVGGTETRPLNYAMTPCIKY